MAIRGNGPFRCMISRPRDGSCTVLAQARMQFRISITRFYKYIMCCDERRCLIWALANGGTLLFNTCHAPAYWVQRRSSTFHRSKARSKATLRDWKCISKFVQTLMKVAFNTVISVSNLWLLKSPTLDNKYPAIVYFLAQKGLAKRFHKLFYVIDK